MEYSIMRELSVQELLIINGGFHKEYLDDSQETEGEEGPAGSASGEGLGKVVIITTMFG